MTPRPTPSKASGFTLVELLVTIAIAGVLLGVAIPSFREVINNNRLTTQANTFLSALTLARSEAVKRGTSVTMLQRSATDGDWNEGWDVFLDNGAGENSGDGELNDDETVIRHFDPLPAGMTLIQDSVAPQNHFIFEGTGLLQGVANATINLCADDTSESYRKIAISSLGRARVTEEAGSCPE